MTRGLIIGGPLDGRTKEIRDGEYMFEHKVFPEFEASAPIGAGSMTDTVEFTRHVYRKQLFRGARSQAEVWMPAEVDDPMNFLIEQYARASKAKATREMLVRAILGSSPPHEYMGELAHRGLGQWTGGHVDRWNWTYGAVEDLKDDEVRRLYDLLQTPPERRKTPPR